MTQTKMNITTSLTTLVLLAIFLSSHAQALTVSHTIDPGDVGNLVSFSPVPVPGIIGQALDGSELIVDIDFADRKHLEVVQDGQFNFLLILFLDDDSNAPRTPPTVFLSDMDGNAIPTTTMQGSATGSPDMPVYVVLFDPLPLGLQFHDVHFSLTLPDDPSRIITNAIFDQTVGNNILRVGEWPTVPEPITATLGLMGLGVLGMATRRRMA